MKIEIVYRDLYDRSGQLLIETMTSEYEYGLIDFGDVLRTNLKNETLFGQQIKDHIDKGELIPNYLTFEVIKHELEINICENILIKSYPKNRVQTELFVKFCSFKNIEIIRAWHMVGLNIMTNLEKNPKYSHMAAKYKSHEHIKLSSERSKMVNENAIGEIGKYCEIEIFKSESHGVNYEKDKLRLKETIHNIRS